MKHASSRRRAPQRRHMVGQAGRRRQPEAAVRDRPSGCAAGRPARGSASAAATPSSVPTPSSNQASPANDVHHCRSVPAHPGELPALARRHARAARATPVPSRGATTSVGWPPRLHAHRDEQTGGAAVDERARLHVAQVGRERAHLGRCAASRRPRRRTRSMPPSDATHAPPRRAGTRKRTAPATPSPSVAGCASSAPPRIAAVEQPAGADDQHAIALDRQERAARRRHRRLAGTEALGQRIPAPSAALRAAGRRGRRSCRRRPGAASPTACRRRPPAPSGTGRATAGAPCDSRRRRRSAPTSPWLMNSRPDGPRVASKVQDSTRPSVEVRKRQLASSGVLAGGGPARGRPRPAARGSCSADEGPARWHGVDERGGWSRRYHQLIGRTGRRPIERARPGTRRRSGARQRRGRRELGDGDGGGGGGACEARTALSARSSPGDTSVSAWPVARARPVRPTRWT